MVSYELRPNPEPSPLRPRQHGPELIRPLGNKAPDDLDLETRKLFVLYRFRSSPEKLGVVRWRTRVDVFAGWLLCDMKSLVDYY